jgi:ATP-binding cassette subfamily F protein uup
LLDDPKSNVTSSAKDLPKSSAVSRAKLSYKETRDLEQLPREIEALEQEQLALVTAMSAADYHKRGAAQMKLDHERAEAIETQLMEKLERWTALEEKAQR